MVVPFLADHGGLEQYLVDLVGLAATRGWQPSVVAPRDLPASSWVRRSLPPQTRWVAADTARSRATDLAVGAAATVGRARSRIRGHDYGDPMQGRLGRLLVERWFWRSSGRRLLGDVDLVHVLGKPKPFVQHALAAGARAGRMMLYSEVAQVTDDYSRRADLVGFSTVANHLDLVTAYCPTQARAIKDRFSYGGPIEIVEQWVDATVEPLLLAAPTPTATGGSRPVVFGSLSRLSPEKGLRWLVDAFARLRRETDLDVRLVIGGTGEEEEAIRARVAGHGLEAVVSLAGYVEDKVAFHRAVDVFVVTSDAEGGPISGLEAMASGRILISTPVGAMPDRLAGSQDGTLVTYGDEAGLAGAMADAAAGLGDRGPTGDLRARYRRDHAHGRPQARMADLWEDLVGRSRRQP